MKHFLTLLLSCLTLSASITGCGFGSGSNQSAGKGNGYDGTYYWSGFESSHTVTIHGNTWSGTSVMYDNVNYEHGRVSGNSIYDPSGYFVVATISGNSIHWNNHTLYKE